MMYLAVFGCFLQMQEWSGKCGSGCIWLCLQMQEWGRIRVVELVVLKLILFFGVLISEGTAKACRGKRFAKKIVDTPPSL